MAFSPGSKVMNGARAKVYVGGNLIGIFTAVSYGLSYRTEPTFVLGREEADEINYTSQDVVSIRASGWRVIGHGAHADLGLPKLKNILNQPTTVVTLHDRQTNVAFAKVREVKVTGMSTSITARQQQEITVQMEGIYLDDESGPNGGAVDASAVPPTNPKT
jgi:hypothetical protein